MSPDHTDRTIVQDESIASTLAYQAVGLLADVAHVDSYHHSDVEEAIGHLEDGLEAAPPNSESGQRIELALANLEGIEDAARDEQPLMVRDALVDLAPVAAGVADVTGGLHKSLEEKPTVPVFYYIPPAVANRAIARMKRRRQRLEAGAEGKYIDQPTNLKELIWDEIDEHPVMWVGGETLAGYASAAGLEDMRLDPEEIREDES